MRIWHWSLSIFLTRIPQNTKLGRRNNMNPKNLIGLFIVFKYVSPFIFLIYFSFGTQGISPTPFIFPRNRERTKKKSDNLFKYLMIIPSTGEILLKVITL